MSQIIVMVGSEANGFNDVKKMEPITEENNIGITGNDYGGSVKLYVDESVRTWRTGGNFAMFDANINELRLEGHTETPIYLVVVLQIFDNWPEDGKGVIILKEKFVETEFDFQVDLGGMISKGTEILK